MSNAAAAKTQSRKKSKKNSQLKEVWRRFRKNKSAMVGLVILVIFALAAIFADLIVPYERAIEQNGSVRLQGPSS